MSSIPKHTLVSCIINAMFSVIFFSLFYSGESELVLGKMSALTMDFLPQALFVGFFSTLPPSIITRMDLKAGKVDYREGISLPLPENFFWRVVVLSLGSLFVFGGGSVLILNFVQPFTISFTVGLVVKAAFGIVLSLVITPIAVMAALRKN